VSTAARSQLRSHHKLLQRSIPDLAIDPVHSCLPNPVPRTEKNQVINQRNELKRATKGLPGRQWILRRRLGGWSQSPAVRVDSRTHAVLACGKTFSGSVRVERADARTLNV